MNRPSILIADGSAPLRVWLSRALQASGPVLEAPSASDALWTLSEEPAISLLVCGPNLYDVPAAALLAMVRTAGLEVPAIVVAPFPTARVRAIVRRAGAAQLLDDWTDTTALRDIADLLQGGPTPRRGVVPPPVAVAG